MRQEFIISALGGVRSPLSVDVTRNNAEKEYLRRLDGFLVSKIQGSDWDFAALSRVCRGAWPGLVAQRLTALGLWTSLRPDKAAQQVVTSAYSPELHPNYFEWYFSDATAAALSNEFLTRDGLNLLWGTPTIALKAAEMGAQFVLVDKNPLLERRFPHLRFSLVNGHVEGLSGAYSNCRTIFLDAPWYLNTIISWLAQAGRFASRGTKIILPPFPVFTRPAAKEERKAILKFAEAIGNISVIPNSVEYDAPLFEWEALLSRHLYAHLNWRRADLLIIDATGESLTEHLNPVLPQKIIGKHLWWARR